MALTGQHGKSVQIFQDIYDVSQFFSQFSVPRTIDEVDITTFGATAKAFLVGFSDGKVSASGFFDQTVTTGSDELLSGQISSNTNQVLTIAPAGAATVGNRVMFCKTKELAYTIEGSVADAVKVKAEWRADGGVEGGYNLHVYQSESSSGSYAQVDIGGASGIPITQGYGAIHVTACTASGAVVKLQYSRAATPTTWVDLISFSAITGTVAEFKSVSGLSIADARYLRANCTSLIGGAMTFAVVGNFR